MIDCPASELVKIKIIRRNLRPEFIRGLGINEFQSVEQLKHHCKLLESDFRRIQSREYVKEFNTRPRSDLPKEKNRLKFL